MLPDIALSSGAGALDFEAPAKEKAGREVTGKSATVADGFGVEVAGRRAQITLANQRFAVADAIDVKYVVKRVSPAEQILWHSGVSPSHLILVEDATGKEPPLTAWGQAGR